MKKEQSTDKEQIRGAILAIHKLDADIETLIRDRYEEVEKALSPHLRRRFRRAVEYCDQAEKDLCPYLVAIFTQHKWYDEQVIGGESKSTTP